MVYKVLLTAYEDHLLLTGYPISYFQTEVKNLLTLQQVP